MLDLSLGNLCIRSKIAPNNKKIQPDDILKEQAVLCDLENVVTEENCGEHPKFGQLMAIR